MNRDDIIQEAYSPLGNPLFCEKTEVDTAGKVIHKVNQHVHDILQRGQITEWTCHYLTSNAS